MLILANLPDSATESADAVKVHFPLWPDRSRPWDTLARSLGQGGSFSQLSCLIPRIHHLNSVFPAWRTAGRRACDVEIIYAVRQIRRRERGTPMAQKIQTLFIDDIDGSEAEGTVLFGLDGTEYEIDLNAGHADALRKALTPYVAAARRSPGTRRPARSAQRASTSGPQSTEVRDWARAQGIDVKDRGRVPAELVVKFKAATGK
jgi:hypothetical protein